ncbi:hypothetical protein BFJ63_vAg9042 [Fusarium oxysporum f. sp. narcissi]|uniref:Uncharacterized protein n=2 Tax=Fusarium oxysporum TaxID=5507 RepID=A0A2H3HNI6_FUSOX|nr:hypothetical protein AU210_007106 [Fusarium oxysporum f. sp. radicis-cucumerinum]RKK90347.1 hypothetical protein BFJ71_g11647 [Fusarium oxysporum]RYC88186.1 hypothetical protein BFJ63_vAg9042 [Fusarium oxysporum f. sp. narcissi]
MEPSDACSCKDVDARHLQTFTNSSYKSKHKGSMRFVESQNAQKLDWAVNEDYLRFLHDRANEAHRNALYTPSGYVPLCRKDQ